MAYWIFKGNPDKYDVDGRLNDQRPEITWRVTRYKKEIAPGDVAFIWRTGPVGGIVAVMEVDSYPSDIEELISERRYYRNLDHGVLCRVRGKIVKKTRCLSRDFLRRVPGLEELSVFHGFQQATNFKVSQEEGRILFGLIERKTFPS